MDWRLPETRREAFLRSYLHSLRYRSFPGCVYFALPYMADVLDWDTEQRYWAAWLNANTQNPITTLLLMEQGSRMQDAAKVAAWQQANWPGLQWDTDRKYQKAKFPQAAMGYAVAMESCGSQSAYWANVQDWDDAWRRMTALPYMGRLSAWSGLEYMRLLGDQPIPDADTLLLEDASGSRSHRNGLALLHGDDHLLHDNQLNPGFSGKWAPDYVQELGSLGVSLLNEARQRTSAKPVTSRGPTTAKNSTVTPSYLTLESALCTWKSWHKRNRRYPNVYSDMFYERIRWAEARHGQRFGVLWDARKDALPYHLRLEDFTHDPGLSAVKQNWYRETGEVPILGWDWGDMWSGFDQMVQDRKFGICR
jgi:hypothetical protein